MSAFSNGTEFREFLGKNCAACVRDGIDGANPDERVRCALLDDVLMSEILDVEYEHPAAWVETGLMSVYDCTERKTQ